MKLPTRKFIFLIIWFCFVHASEDKKNTGDYHALIEMEKKTDNNNGEKMNFINDEDNEEKIKNGILNKIPERQIEIVYNQNQSNQRKTMAERLDKFLDTIAETRCMRCISPIWNFVLFSALYGQLLFGIILPSPIGAGLESFTTFELILWMVWKNLVEGLHDMVLPKRRALLKCAERILLPLLVPVSSTLYIIEYNKPNLNLGNDCGWNFGAIFVSEILWALIFFGIFTCPRTPVN